MAWYSLLYLERTLNYYQPLSPKSALGGNTASDLVTIIP